MHDTPVNNDATPGAEVHADGPVPVTRIVEALSAAGLFVSMSPDFPDVLHGIADDSRKATPGCAFIAVRGHAQDGHDWLPQAERGGAVCVILEDSTRTALPAIVVRDGRRAAAVAAAAFYNWPALEVQLVGVTGTNGKTTTVGLLRHLLDSDTHPAASIGTLGVLTGSQGDMFPGGDGLTTPGPVELQRLLRALVARGVKSVVMEVSSHSLDQRRVEGLSFAVALFTNLTRDHLDYHGTMERYLGAKSRLIGLLARNGTAVVNDDDTAWRDLPAAAHRVSFGLHVGAEVSARDIVYEAQGSRFQLVASTGAASVLLPLIGEFNVSNAVAAAAAALVLNVPLADVAHKLANAPQVPGRLEKLRVNPTVLRDYAHTPDSLERALKAVRPFTGNGDTAGRLIVVFGCGGDRDRGKRPVMGEIAERLADHAIVTSDNPRTENPERILDDIEAGMKNRGHERIEDRRQAIAHALKMAAANDVILLAGKGHETYQIRGTVSHHFDEKEIVAELSAS
ncbi:MAG: UDP-N-acetylmuramoyl-L-alanyl-D-glutamate--2,6-diaminopimelate ligase [Phycisphaerae bacterium]|nr:UDP-N-acetylmuramoyl-L-alanyl-D-glutamate--2,6-diaminopimelate ligase [Gemmatimonadaceae bacterium]